MKKKVSFVVLGMMLKIDSLLSKISFSFYKIVIWEMAICYLGAIRVWIWIPIVLALDYIKRAKY